MHSPLFVVDFNQAIISKPKSMLVQSQITFWQESLGKLQVEAISPKSWWFIVEIQQIK
jgi:hypothetical protein